MQRRGGCAAHAGRHWPILPSLSWLWVGHEVAKGHRVHGNRLLKKPVEEHSPGTRSSAIKAEGEFIQVGLQVVGANRPLMGAHQPPFYESGDSVHSWEYFVRIFAGTLDGGTLVGVIDPGCSWIGCQSVSMDRGAGLNMSQEKGSQSVSFGIGDDLNSAPAKSFGLRLFNRHRDKGLASSPAAALPRPNAANHGLIHFDIAGQSIMLGVTNGGAEAVKHRPGSLVGAESKKAMEGFGGHPVLRRSHVPGGREPYRKGCFRVMKDGASRGRYTAPTCLAPPSAIAHAPPCVAGALRTRKAVRPTEPVKIIEASGIIREPAEKVCVVLGVILTGHWPTLQLRALHPKMLASPHLYGYPTYFLPGLSWSICHMVHNSEQPYRFPVAQRSLAGLDRSFASRSRQIFVAHSWRPWETRRMACICIVSIVYPVDDTRSACPCGFSFAQE